MVYCDRTVDIRQISGNVPASYTKEYCNHLSSPDIKYTCLELQVK